MLQPSIITLHAYDGCASQPQGILTNVPIEFVEKIVYIDIKVVNAQLDENILDTLT